MGRLIRRWVRRLRRRRNDSKMVGEGRGVYDGCLYRVCGGGDLYFGVAKILLDGWVWGGNIDRLVLIKEVIHTSILISGLFLMIFLCHLPKQDAYKIFAVQTHFIRFLLS
jgi:hypothetical protein